MGVFSRAAGHRTRAPLLIEVLRARGADEILVICGGVTPAQDDDELLSEGVNAIFYPGGSIPDAAR